MKLPDVLRTLRSKGTAQNRKVYARHGYPEDTYGVSFGELRKLATTLGRDQDLARGLWKSGNGDARVLAVMVAEPDGMSTTELDAWVREIRFYVLGDAFSQLAARSPLAKRKSAAWRRSKSDPVSQVGWNLVSILAAPDGELSDADLAPLLDQIEREIHAAPNRTRHAMNMALCAIGGYRPALHDRALEVARAIGKVEVDHGETGCKTPDATSYIARMGAHQGRRKTPARAGSGRGSKAATRKAAPIQGVKKAVTRPAKAGKAASRRPARKA
jgi:3-methyladenine DNA glycosylase AlkD